MLAINNSVIDEIVDRLDLRVFESVVGLFYQGLDVWRDLRTIWN